MKLLGGSDYLYLNYHKLKYFKIIKLKFIFQVVLKIYLILIKEFYKKFEK